jgi:HEAT repeat protein
VALPRGRGTDGAHNGRKLLRTWESDRSGTPTAVRKREVAANASWRIAAMNRDAEIHEFALEQLRRHIRDIPRVRTGGGIWARQLVSRRNTHDLQPRLARLARDPDEIVRRRTGVALSRLNHRAPDEAEAVFAEWLASEDTKRLWTAAYALLVTRSPVAVIETGHMP